VLLSVLLVVLLLVLLLPPQLLLLTWSLSKPVRGGLLHIQLPMSNQLLQQATLQSFGSMRARAALLFVIGCAGAGVHGGHIAALCNWVCHAPAQLGVCVHIGRVRGA
jgi:hypothetical protein